MQTHKSVPTILLTDYFNNFDKTFKPHFAFKVNKTLNSFTSTLLIIFINVYQHFYHLIRCRDGTMHDVPSLFISLDYFSKTFVSKVSGSSSPHFPNIIKIIKCIY